MQKNSASQSGLFNPRVLLAFALCSAGCFLAMLSFAAPTRSGQTSTPASPPDCPITGGCQAWLALYDGPAHGLAESISEANRYATRDTIGYPTPGSLGSYAGIDHRVPIITLELPRGISADAAWQANREALYRAIR